MTLKNYISTTRALACPNNQQAHASLRRGDAFLLQVIIPWPIQADFDTGRVLATFLSFLTIKAHENYNSLKKSN